VVAVGVEHPNSAGAGDPDVAPDVHLHAIGNAASLDAYAVAYGTKLMPRVPAAVGTVPIT